MSRTLKKTNSIAALALFFLWYSATTGILLVDAAPCFTDKTTLNRVIASATMLNDGDRSGVGYVHETYGPIESWCFDSSLTDFSGLFIYKSQFNADISGWDVSSVTSMRSMVSAIIKP